MPRPPYLPGPQACRALDLHCAGYGLTEIAARLGNTPSTVSKLLTAGARALGLPNGNRVLLAVTWSQVSPLIDAAKGQQARADALRPAQPTPAPQQEQTPGPVPIYTLIDPLTRRRRPPPEEPEVSRTAREPETLPPAALKALAALNAHTQALGGHAVDAESPQRRRTLRPARKFAGPIAAQKRADVAHHRIGMHARWTLRHRPRQCERCAYSRFVDVCHRRPVCTFPADALLSDINAIDNLIYLCPNCHREFDAGLWTLPQPGKGAQTVSQQQIKQAAYTSRYRGVCWDKQKELWRASIFSQGRRYALGRFREERDAALAYNAAALRLWGEHAVLNDLD